MAILIDKGQAYEQAVMKIPFVQGNRNVLLAIQGWEWWQVVAIQTTLDNTLAATPAWGQMQLSIPNVVLAMWVAGTVVPNGQSSFLSFSVCGSPGVATNLAQSVGIGEVPMIGDGFIGSAIQGGDIATVFGDTTAVIIGRRHRNRSK